MANFLIYRTDFGNTIVRETPTDTSTGGTEQSISISLIVPAFVLPPTQPIYYWMVNLPYIGTTTVSVNSETYIALWKAKIAIPPTSDTLATAGYVTGITSTLSADINYISGVTDTKLDISTYTGYTTTNGLQQVTNINAITNIESTFNNGIKTNKIRPTGDTINAIQVHKADGITNIINIDTVSGFTGFGTIIPKNKVHLYGTDTHNMSEYSVQSNGLTLDGVSGADKEIVWANNGVPKWQAQTFRNENDVFWYLVNTQSQSNPLTIMETGRFGINKQSNYINYHTAEIVAATGLDDLIVSGIYSQNYNTVYEVEIVSTGITDMWHWRKSIDAGVSYNNYSPSSGATLTPVELEFGAFANFENITGHGVGAKWRFAAFSQIPQATLTLAPMGIAEVQKTLNYNANPIVYKDITATANGGISGNNFNIFNAGTGGTKEAFYLGFSVQAQMVYFNIEQNTVGGTLITQYWNSNINDWTTLSYITNSYIDGTDNLNKSGRIIWQPNTMTGWNKDYINNLSGSGYQLYWIRLITTSIFITAPIAKNVSIGDDKRFSVYNSFDDYRPDFYIDSSGRVNIGGGTITGNNKFQVNPSQGLSTACVCDSDSYVEFDSENSSLSMLKLKVASNDTCGTILDFSRTRGTLDTPLSMETNDSIGKIIFRGRVGTASGVSAAIQTQYTGDGSTTRKADLIFGTACGNCTASATEKVRITSSGTTGFGVTAPTAIAHLKAGTTSIAPLKFNSGSLLSSPQAGAVEFCGNNFYGTTTGDTRKTFAFLESPIFSGNVSMPSGTTFIGGLSTNKIRPLIDSTTALQITKANGITPVVNINTISGLTGFGTITPKGLVHAYGTDSGGDKYYTQSNAVIVDGPANVDKDIQWAEQGVPKWLAETYRGENSEFWYLYNVDSDNNPIVVSETGRIGISSRTDIMDSHAILNSGSPNDLIVGGAHTQNYICIYQISINSITGITDTWIWRSSNNEGITYSNWSSPSGATLTPVIIEHGVTVSFNNVTGHASGTTWTFAAFAQLPLASFVISTPSFDEILTTNNYNAPIITYTDITAKANSTTFGGDIIIFNTGTTLSSVYFGTGIKIQGIFVNMETIGSGIILSTEYWNGSDWTAIDVGDNYIDRTNNLTLSGEITWNKSSITNWNRGYLPNLSGDNYNLFWIRFTTSTTPITSPIANSFTRGNNKRFAVMSSPYDVRPKFYVDSLGRTNIGGGNIVGKNVLQVNTSIVSTNVSTQSIVEIDSEDSTASDLKIKLDSNDTCSGGLVLVKTRGTLAVPLDTQIGDSVGHIDFRGRHVSGQSLLSKIETKLSGIGTGTFGDLIFNTACNSILSEKVRITGSGTTGFGVITPTAIMHLKAGTTSIAPFKFNSGNLLSSPQIGAVEFLNDSWYGTTTSGTERKTFAFLESPIFTGHPQLSIGTCLIPNSVDLNDYIWNSGGTNNSLLLKTCTFNTYTGGTQTAISKVITGATNGICRYGCHEIKFGGLFCENTTIGACGYDFTLCAKKFTIASHSGTDIFDLLGNNINIFSSGGTVSLYGKTSGGTEAIRFIINQSQATFTDSRATPRGIQYSANYCGGFNGRSLVDKEYVDNIASGIFAKEAVIVASTSNIRLSGLSTVDGVSLTNGMRVLAKNQTTGSTNGIYLASASTWNRSSDLNGVPPLGDIVPGSYVAVISGNTNKNTSWILNTPLPITAGTTVLTFVLFSSSQGTVAGNGICVISAGGNYNISVNAPTNCGLCIDSTGVYVNSAIAGTGLNYSAGILSVCGSNLAGNSISWTGNTFNVNPATGTLNTALNSKLNTTIYQTYTGTTAPARFLDKTIYQTYTGTTAPARFLDKTIYQTYTGTTIPTTYTTISCFNAYTGATKTIIDCKANIASPTFTGTVRSVTPSTSDNSTCIATTAWYIGQCATATPNMDSNGGTVGTSALWAHGDHTHPSDTTRLITTIYQTYTGTTAPTRFLDKTIYQTYTGTTVPNTYLSKGTFTTYTGTTVPNTYYSKTQIDSYTGQTKTTIDRKAYLSGATFTGVVNVQKPAQNDNSTCAATTSWYISQGGTANALMDGSAGCGISNLFARQDHVHPSDTTRLITTIYQTYTGTTAPNTFAPKASPTFTGTVTIPTPFILGAVNVKTTGTELNYVTGVTSNIQSQINTKVGVASPTFTGTVTIPTPFILGAISVKTTGTELNYVTGVTSNIQSQINLKAPITSPTFIVSARSVTPAINNNDTCIATTAWYVGQGSNVNPLMNGIAASGTSLYFSRQDHVHPRDTSKLSLSGGTMTGTLRGTIITGSTCLISPIILGSTYICSPIITGSTRVCSPIIFGGTCVSGAISCGTTCVTSPVIFGSTCSNSPLHCGACMLATSYVCSPVITGSTRICSPIVCGTSCVQGLKIIENTTCLASTYSQLNTLIVSLTGNTSIDATYAGKTIEANGTFTITLPNGMATGMQVDIVNVGAGTITLAASTTLQSKSSRNKLASQYIGASAYHRGSNVWIAVGDLTP